MPTSSPAPAAAACGSAARAQIRDAVPVLFDPSLDVALLYVDGLQAVPLSFAAHDPERGAIGATLGYPGGGPLDDPAGRGGRPLPGDRARHLRPGAGPPRDPRAARRDRARRQRRPARPRGRDGRRHRLRRGADQPGRRLRPVRRPRSRRPSGPAIGRRTAVATGACLHRCRGRDPARHATPGSGSSGSASWAGRWPAASSAPGSR